MKKIVVAGAGGFIGGHLVKELVKKGHSVRAVDLKPLNEWYQVSGDADNLVLDLRLRDNCYKAVNGYNEVFNLAADMGGMGFIENNKAACMISVLINTHFFWRQKNAESTGFSMPLQPVYIMGKNRLILIIRD